MSHELTLLLSLSACWDAHPTLPSSNRCPRATVCCVLLCAPGASRHCTVGAPGGAGRPRGVRAAAGKPGQHSPEGERKLSHGASPATAHMTAAFTTWYTLCPGCSPAACLTSPLHLYHSPSSVPCLPPPCHRRQAERLVRAYIELAAVPAPQGDNPEPQPFPTNIRRQVSRPLHCTGASLSIFAAAVNFEPRCATCIVVFCDLDQTESKPCGRNLSLRELTRGKPLRNPIHV